MPPRRRWRFEPETHEAIRESETRHLMVTPTAFPLEKLTCRSNPEDLAAVSTAFINAIKA
jgi:hypothetical protein